MSFFNSVICLFVSYRRADVKLVTEFPSISAREMPTIAIITSLYCEKMAVDAMLDSKITYIKHVADASSPGIERTIANADSLCAMLIYIIFFYFIPFISNFQPINQYK